MSRLRCISVLAFTIVLIASTGNAQTAKPTNLDPRLDAFKKEVASAIDARAKMAQEMVDSVFSFGELGFQEVETSHYLTAIAARMFSGMPELWPSPWPGAPSMIGS